MKIRQYFHSEDDLAQKMGKGFLRAWKRLLEKYSKRIASLGVHSLKLASLSFAFFTAAEEGNAEMMYHFDDMLHGWSPEKLWLGETLVSFTDQEYVNFVWDGAALMLEADPELPQKSQLAFDLATEHVSYAYEVCQEEEVVSTLQYDKVKDIDNCKSVGSSNLNEQEEVYCSLDYILDVLEGAPALAIDYVKEIQLKLYKDYGRVCSERDYERIGRLADRVVSNAPACTPLPAPAREIAYTESNSETATIEKFIDYAEKYPANQNDRASVLKEAIADIFDMSKVSGEMKERFKMLGKKEIAQNMLFNAPVQNAIGYNGLIQYTDKERGKQ